MDFLIKVQRELWMCVNAPGGDNSLDFSLTCSVLHAKYFRGVQRLIKCRKNSTYLECALTCCPPKAIHQAIAAPKRICC